MHKARLRRLATEYVEAAQEALDVALARLEEVLTPEEYAAFVAECERRAIGETGEPSALAEAASLKGGADDEAREKWERFLRLAEVAALAELP